jgi:putative colanic acid biosynthesis UDP-glucose lipid carrier transferase
MNKNFSQLLRVVFALLDFLALNAVFLITKYFFQPVIPEFAVKEYFYFFIFCNGMWLLSSLSYSVYQGHNTSSFEIFLKRTTKVFFLFLICSLTYLYFMRETDMSRLFILTFFIAFPVCILINRLIYLIAYLYFRKRDYIVKRVLIIGHNTLGRKLANHLESKGMHMQIVGFCEEEYNVEELSTYPILCTPVSAIQISAEYKINEIYSTILPEQDKRIYNLMEEADRASIRFKLVPDLSFFVKRPMYVDYLGDMPILSPRSEPLDDIGNRIKKRSLDLAVSSLVIILILSWLVPIISLLIWLESRGPVFFIQKRSGVNNKTFNCLKFRSMKVNTGADLKQAVRNDDRLTPIGKFLRKTNLDEFPQFFNVFMGSMSIVGPRPHMLKHTEDYSQLYDQYVIRHFMKPGITGWAQIHGYRGEITSRVDIKNRVEHDLWYMENWNQWLDFKIIFLTAYNMVRGQENAY